MSETHRELETFQPESQEDQQTVFKRIRESLGKFSGLDFLKNPNLRRAAALTFLLEASSIMTGNASAQSAKEKTNIELPFELNKLLKQVTINFESGDEQDQQNKLEQTPEVLQQSKWGRFESEAWRTGSAEKFFELLSKKSNELSADQKINFLQMVGETLGTKYDLDLRDSRERILISDQQMFEALTGRSNQKAGICGNIHAFIARTAQELGLPAWEQAGSSMAGGGHFWTGVVIEKDGKEQIAFIDYGRVVLTGTSNYQKALGIMERANARVFLLSSLAHIPGQETVQTSSFASETAEKASGMEGADKKLAKVLEGEESPLGLQVNFNQQSTKVKFTNDFLAIAYNSFENKDNQYNSLANLKSLSVGGGNEFKDFHLEGGTTFLHMNVRDLENNSQLREAIVFRVAADFVNTRRLSAGEFGEFSIKFGATLEAATAFVLNEKDTVTGGKGEGAFGARLIYINPAETGKFYVETRIEEQAVANNAEQQQLEIKEKARHIEVGGEYQVREGVIVNFKSAVAQIEQGSAFEGQVGLSGRSTSAQVEYKKNSGNLFALPRQIVTGSISHRLGNSPKALLTIYGTSDSENEMKSLGAKLQITLW